jgi:ankyrin repeat protein
MMDFNDAIDILATRPVALEKVQDLSRILQLRGVNEETLLHFCAIEGMLGAVKWLIDNGAPVNTKSSFGSTPLMDAAMNNHFEVVRELLRGGADSRMVDNIGYTIREKLLLLGMTTMLSALDEIEAK